MSFPNLTPYPFSLAPGEQVQIDSPGEFARVLEATGTVDFRFERETWLQASQGLGFKLGGGATFSSVQLRNTSGATVTGKLILGFGEITDDRVNVVNALTIRQIGAPKLYGLERTAITASAQNIADGGADQAAVFVQAVTSNTELVTLSTADGAEIILYPGDSIEIATQSIVRAVSAGGGQTLKGYVSKYS